MAQTDGPSAQVALIGHFATFQGAFGIACCIAGGRPVGAGCRRLAADIPGALAADWGAAAGARSRPAGRARADMPGVVADGGPLPGCRPALRTQGGPDAAALRAGRTLRPQASQRGPDCRGGQRASLKSP